MTMKAKEIRDLIDFIAQTGLEEVNIETEDIKLAVKKNPNVVVSEAPAVAVQSLYLLRHAGAESPPIPERFVALQYKPFYVRPSLP